MGLLDQLDGAQIEECTEFAYQDPLADGPRLRRTEGSRGRTTPGRNGRCRCRPPPRRPNRRR
jgi:hypothetical protein